MLVRKHRDAAKVDVKDFIRGLNALVKRLRGRFAELFARQVRRRRQVRLTPQLPSLWSVRTEHP